MVNIYDVNKPTKFDQNDAFLPNQRGVPFPRKKEPAFDWGGFIFKTWVYGISLTLCASLKIAKNRKKSFGNVYKTKIKFPQKLMILFFVLLRTGLKNENLRADYAQR